MKTTAGARVWAIQGEDKTTVWVYGHGTYLGDFPMPGWDHPNMLAMCAATIRRHDAEPPIIDPHVYYGGQVEAGKLTREQADAEIARVEAAEAAEKARPLDDRALKLARSLGRSPKIRLDSGGTVWGAECWWTPMTDDPGAVERFVNGRQVVQLEAPHPDAEEVALANRVRVAGDLFHGQVPAGAVYVGRGAPGLSASKYANPFRVGLPTPDWAVNLLLDGQPLARRGFVEDRAHAVLLYRYWIYVKVPFTAADVEADLRGRNLACWCPESQPCHADVLLELANPPARAHARGE